MATLLLRHADWLVTMDDQRQILADGGLFARDGAIEQVGRTADLPTEADEVIDARGYVILPGLVNTHHHMFQALGRCSPAAQDLILQEWLAALAPLWIGLTGDAAHASARLVLAELLLSGCTTAFDHHHLLPNDTTLDRVIEAARELGIRFMAGRGGQTIGRHNGGTAPTELCEDEEHILADCERLVRAYHDPRPLSMCQIVIAPGNLLRISKDLVARLIELARKHGVRGHTHLGETVGELPLFRERYGCRPFEFAEEVGWVGPDVWYAHGIHFADAEIERIGRAGAGVAHCPSSNMRIASGILPLGKLKAAGVPIGLGVDGSASNDSSNILVEARLALLLQRVARGSNALTADDTLECATRGGAQVLGRDDIGVLAPGRAADFIGYDTHRREFAGALSDPIAALVLCLVPTVDLSVVNGRVLVRNGQLLGFDWDRAVAEHNRYAEALIRRAEEATGQSFRRQERRAVVMRDA